MRKKPKKPKKPKKGKRAMGLPGGMVWEVRRGSSGSGGFINIGGGTDRTQQDNPQIADPGDWEFKNNDYDRIYSSTEDANLDGTTPGNTILITGDGGSGAFTPGTYHITANGNDGGGNYIDIDRDAGTANAADGNGVLGGAADVEDIDSKVVAGNVVYIQYDATDYAPAATVNFSTVGSAANPVIIIGYNSSRDDDPIPGGNQPTFAMGANYFQVNSNYIVKHCNFETTTGAYAFYSAGTKVWLVRCGIHNPNVTANRYGVYLSNNSHLIGCEIECANGRAIRVGSVPHILYNYVHDSNEGILTVVAGTAIVHNIFASIATDAIPGASVTDVLVLRNTFYDCVDAITGTVTFSGTIMNNQFTNGVDGVDLTGEGNYFADWNNWWTNSGADVSNFTKGDNATAVNPGYATPGSDFSDVDQTDAFVLEIGV